MTIGFSGLALLAFACLSIGCCVGMIIISMCQVSAEKNKFESEEK